MKALEQTLNVSMDVRAESYRIGHRNKNNSNCQIDWTLNVRSATMDSLKTGDLCMITSNRNGRVALAWLTNSDKRECKFTIVPPGIFTRSDDQMHIRGLADIWIITQSISYSIYEKEDIEAASEPIQKEEDPKQVLEPINQKEDVKAPLKTSCFLALVDHICKRHKKNAVVPV